MSNHRIEVFIAFTKTTNVHELRATFEAWDTPEYEPAGIQVQANKFDLLRRVAAEGLSHADYLIADLGSRPGDETGVQYCIKGRLKVEECESRSSSE